ncbi:replication-related protein [Halogeometricum pallidum JCM 14848]|uniref:Replication-related protein n=1 Tax=Halogeometricum pallidum JCM 14848 TaxID=1227487 RepID=M0DD55_HALPD|nr:replication-related protein [Halogeometricum pallidum]ELZ33405.1 replication-related protein [Halogeometricum pallidum JCM 14848]
MPNRASRPLSVRNNVKLREEATREKHEDSTGARRSAPWSSVLREFLTWYNDYRYLHLRFRDPDGNLVRGQMSNSHQPRYRNRYYARIKALERQAIAQFDDLYVTMLSLTGSMQNANGGWRAPADHLRDVVSSWRPDRGRGVYHALRDSLSAANDVTRWEYAIVTEHHANGYGHIHVAVFTDGPVDQETFRPAVNAHVRKCDIAGAEAHQVTGDGGVVSVSRVNPDLDPDDYDGSNEVGNLGSYIAEYIGAGDDGGDLLDRELSELIHRAACWATGTQRVRFSTGANELIDDDLAEEPDTDDGEPILVPRPEFDPDADDPGATVGYGAPHEVMNEGWTLDGIGTVDEDGEDVFDPGHEGVIWMNIDDARHLDPPNIQPPPLTSYD